MNPSDRVYSAGDTWAGWIVRLVATALLGGAFTLAYNHDAKLAAMQTAIDLHQSNHPNIALEEALREERGRRRALEDRVRRLELREAGH